jgi:peptide/nickel transport system permease protein
MAAAWRMIARRLMLLVPLLLGVTLAVFLAVQLLPGDPATSSLGVFADREARQLFVEQNNLDDPVWVRYPRFLGQLAQGDLGVSLTSGLPVREQIGDALPITIQLTLLAVAMAAAFALVAGVASAVRRGGALDAAVRVLSMGGLAAPGFWVGLLLIHLVAVSWGILPPGGYSPPSEGIGDWLSSLLLPSLALAIPVGASLTRVVRASMLEELEKDYVRTARSLGLAPGVVVRNVMHNALITPLTVLGVRVGYLLSGAVLIETIFNLPGTGQLLVDAVDDGDLAMIQGLVLVSTTLFVLVNLAVDVCYLLLNPRIREA